MQVEITKPNEEGRQEIIDIVFRKLLRNGRVTKRVAEICNGEIREQHTVRWRKRKPLRAITRGFTGADLSALVRSAVSFALERDNDENWIVEEDDLMDAVVEVKSSMNYN